jgi:hypothetical protein
MSITRTFEVAMLLKAKPNIILAAGAFAVCTAHADHGPPSVSTDTPTVQAMLIAVEYGTSYPG